jgi:cytochrome c oxidase subunit 2
VLVLPVDRTITFRLASDDVIHSFWVPAFTRKLDVVPGQDNQLRVHPNVTGEYRGHCAEYCGLDHARMNFAVEVVSQDEFDAFLEEADR